MSKRLALPRRAASRLGKGTGRCRTRLHKGVKLRWLDDLELN